MTRRFPREMLTVAASLAVVLAACNGPGAVTPSPAPTSRPTAVPTARASVPAAASASSIAPTSGSGASAGAGPVDLSSCPKAAPAPMAAGQTRTVTIDTPSGSIVIKVQASLGPRAAANFVALAQCGYYVNVVFHRLVPGFVIQGGDGQFGRLPKVSSAVGSGGPGYEFADDPVTIPYTRGVVAMANSGPDTNGSQFFIVLADVSLDPNYSVFGRVTSGMDVVDKIAAMPNSGGQSNSAINPVPMTKVTVATP